MSEARRESSLWWWEEKASLELSPFERGHGGHNRTPGADGSVRTWCRNDLRRLLQVYK